MPAGGWLGGEALRNESGINSTNLCPGPPRSQALRWVLRMEGERDGGWFSKELRAGVLVWPPTSEAAALLPPTPRPLPHLVTAWHPTLWPGLILEGVEGVLAPLLERSPDCHCLGPLERRGRQLLKTKATTVCLGPAKRSNRPLWSALGCGT